MKGLLLAPWIVLGASFAFNSFAQSLLDVDASGQAGQRGSAGISYDPSPRWGTFSFGWRGDNGSNGGNAGNATPGSDAGQIEIRLGLDPNRNVVVDGKRVMPEGTTTSVTKQFPINSKGMIYLEAHGGRGGDGGVGGDGQGGGRGPRGSDASRYSSGTNGGRGGDGGDGGWGTSGEHGGKGGNIVVEVTPENMHLLMLVANPDVQGGPGGKPGRNGRGGSGGAGGAGGNSYSWSEPYSDTESYTDSKGNSHTRSVTRYRYRSNSGGFSGSYGSRGSDGNAAIYPGQPGADGRVIYRVNDKGTIHDYTNRYDLALAGFKYDSENNDGINEPGETIHVHDIHVRNTGSMPTPANQPVVISLNGKKWVQTTAQNLRIPKSLAPGEEYTFPATQKIDVRVTDTTVQRAGQRFKTQDDLDPKAVMGGVNRVFGGFDYPTSMPITYPIEVTTVKAPTTLEAGESATVIYKVTNISKQALGANSPSKRRLMVEFKSMPGELKAKDISYTNANGQKVPMDSGFTQEIPILKPGQSILVQGNLGIESSVPYYADANLRFALKLGTLKTPASVKTLQMQDVSVRVAQGYKKTSGSGILLVTNNNTQRAEIEAWKALGADLHMPVDVWDVSHHQLLDLTRKLSSNSSLAQDFKGKTIVVLNNVMRAAGDSLQAPITTLSREDFVRAAAKDGTRFYVVGGAFDAQTRLAAKPGDRVPGHMYNSPDAFLRAVDQHRGGTLPLSTEKIKVVRSTMLGAPSVQDLANEAKRVQQDLKNKYPERRYKVEANYAPKKLKQGLIFGDWSAGTLEIQRTIDKNGAAVALSVKDNALHTPSFVKGSENKIALLAAMDFEQKLKLFNEKVMTKPLIAGTPDDALASALSQAILIDLAREQATLRNPNSKGGLPDDVILSKLVKLKRLSNYPFNAYISPSSRNAEHVLDLVAHLKQIVNSQATWLNWLTPFNRDAEVSWNSGQLIDRFVQRAFRTTNNLNIAKSRIESRVQKLDREFAARATSQGTDKKALILRDSQKPKNNPDEFHTDSDVDPGIVIYKKSAPAH